MTIIKIAAYPESAEMPNLKFSMKSLRVNEEVAYIIAK